MDFEQVLPWNTKINNGVSQEQRGVEQKFAFEKYDSAVHFPMLTKALTLYTCCFHKEAEVRATDLKLLLIIQ